MRRRIGGGDLELGGYGNFCRRQAGFLVASLVGDGKRDFLRSDRRGGRGPQSHEHRERAFVNTQRRRRKLEFAHDTARIRRFDEHNAGGKIRRDFGGNQIVFRWHMRVHMEAGSDLRDNGDFEGMAARHWLQRNVG